MSNCQKCQKRSILSKFSKIVKFLNNLSKFSKIVETFLKLSKFVKSGKKMMSQMSMSLSLSGLKGHPLYVKSKNFVSEWVSQWLSVWQGYLLSCSWQLKTTLSKLLPCQLFPLDQTSVSAAGHLELFQSGRHDSHHGISGEYILRKKHLDGFETLQELRNCPSYSLNKSKCLFCQVGRSGR